MLQSEAVEIEERADGQSETEGTPPTPSLSHSVRTAADGDVEAGPSGACGSGASTIEPGRSIAVYTSIEEKHRQLVVAIKTRDVKAVKQRLMEGAPLSHHGLFGYTPMHVAVETNRDYLERQRTPSAENLRADTIRVIQELVKACSNSEVLDSLNEGGYSPLSLAIQAEDLDIIVALVKAGANVNCVDQKRSTALHVAAKNHTLLKYFMDTCKIENTIDSQECAAIHYAASFDEVESLKLLFKKFGQDQLTYQNAIGWTVWHEVVNNHATNMAQYLLETSNYCVLGLNIVDKSGRSPVFLSIQDGYDDMTSMLLRNGATLSAEGESKTAIKLITTELDEPSQFLKKIFDECIYETSNQIIVNYKVLVDKGNKEKSQINVIEELVRCGQSKLLKHPTIESLIYIKWSSFSPVFYTMIGTYVMFMLSLNTLVVTTFNKMAANETSSTAAVDEAPCHEGCEWHYWVLSVFIYISVGVLLIQEGTWERLQEFRYWPSLDTCRHIRLQSIKRLPLEPCVKLSALLLALCVPPALGCARAPAAPWQRHLACAAMLLAWLQAMLLLARVPGWGHYVLMFERVAFNILKIFMTSICLVLGFSICFMIQFQSKPPFDGFFPAFVKTLVMMSSEFDYEDLSYKHDAELKDSITLVRLLFVVFVIFVAIVLMNFMIGVAVSDVNELAAIGAVRRLEKQLELLSTLEKLGSTVLGKWWELFFFNLSSIRFHKQICRDLKVDDPYSTTYFSGKKWKLTTMDSTNCVFDQTLPMKMQIAILDISRNKKPTVTKLDALYDAVVEIPDTQRRNVSDDSRSSVKTLKDRITAIEASIKEITCTNKVVNDRIRTIGDSNKEIINSMKDLKEKMNSIADMMSPRNKE